MLLTMTSKEVLLSPVEIDLNESSNRSSTLGSLLLESRKHMLQEFATMLFGRMAHKRAIRWSCKRNLQEIIDGR